MRLLHTPHTSTAALHLEVVDRLIAKGGPDESDYDWVDRWTIDLRDAVLDGELTQSDLLTLRSAFGDAFSTDTMQGFAFCKPHGYAGDYEIIDRIYNHYISPEPHLSRWDRYWQSRPGAIAVRNRKSYFHQLLDKVIGRHGSIDVLKVAVGPGRSMYEWFERNPDADARFECVEIDRAAIEYAARLNHRHLDRITFVQRNAMRYQATKRFDLVWSAGLFDYFNDRLFVAMVKRLMTAVKPGGELVIGNFSDTNPGRAYMELFDWILFHRSEEQLIDLALEAGVEPEQISIGCEPEGVNLFLHIEGGGRRTEDGGRD